MQQFKDEKYFSAYIIGVSILVGAILISASIFYNTKIILNKMAGSPTEITNKQNLVQQGQAQNTDKIGNITTRVGAPILGNKDAKVTIVEFSDFQCPFCKSFFQNTFPEILKKYIDTGKIRLVFQNLPLPFHINAEKAAEAGECANRQGKFWDYHDLLFINSQSDGTGLDTASLKKYANQLGLDTQKFNQCLDNGEAAAIVKADQTNGQNNGVSGTPTFFINGTKILGAQPMATFTQVIDGLLK